MEYDIVIGLEIHSELKTKSKIFCSCPTTFGAEENENVCEVCLGLPGTLPVLNEKVVEYAVRAGLALNCEIAHYSKLDRKNYFYPDLPKAYQISQYDLPLCAHGHLFVTDEDGNEKKIGITRIHIEEDAGKLIHTGNSTLLDNNRCGVPLIEIVSEPDMTSAHEAEAYARRIKSILEAADVSDCKMQEGSIRFDINLSVKPKGSDKLGTRTEMKNLNSFRGLLHAIEYETKRQIDVIESGGAVIQETRRWDDAKGISIAMRSKENAHDYRYFPDPDLVPIVLTDEYINEIKASLPEMPHEKSARYTEEYGLGVYDAELLTQDACTSVFFEEAVKASGNAKTCANFIIGDIAAKLKNTDDDISSLPFDGSKLGALVALSDKGEINLKIAKKVLDKMFETGDDPAAIVEKEGLKQVTDTGAIKAVVQQVIDANPQSVEDIKNGKGKAVSFIVGQVMRQTKGKANPQMVNQLIDEIIKEM
jgi:aspartyl-tRNA(Asn)/glutamyl-tRNA(Gln) amidotransferase subunit B